MKNRKLIIIALAVIILILSQNFVKADEKGSSSKVVTKWSIDSKTDKSGIAFNKIVGLRFSGDGSRLFVLEQPYDMNESHRFFVFNSDNGRLLGIEIPELQKVSAFCPNLDGSKLFVVAEDGRRIIEVDVSNGRSHVIYSKKSTGFRMSPPLWLNVGKDGSLQTRGYFLDKKGTSGGDYIVSMKTSGGKDLKIEKLVSYDRFLKNSRKGEKTSLILTCDNRRKLACVSEDGKKTKLFTADRLLNKRPKLIDDGFRMLSLALCGNGSRIVYILVDNSYYLKVADTSSETKSFNIVTLDKVAKGKFNPPYISPDGKKVLFGKVTTLPLKQELYYAGAEDNWKLHELKARGWKKTHKATLYQLADNGKTFVLWGKDQILVGELPQ